MNHKLIVILLALASFLPALADDAAKSERWRKEMRQYKANFISTELNLTEQQREKFVPLYEEMDDKLDQESRAARKIEKEVEKKGSAATEADYDKATEAMFSLRSKEATIEMTYYTKFAKLLNKQQMFKLKGAERKFMRKVMEQYKRGTAEKGKKKQHHKGAPQ